MVRRHVTTTLSIVDRERLEHVFSTSVLSLIVSGPSENIIHYILYIVCVYVTVYRKTGHNAAPFEKFFLALTELSASRY